MIDAKSLFNVYRLQAGEKTYDGKPIPEWEDLGEAVRQCWTAAAYLVNFTDGRPVYDVGYSQKELRSILNYMKTEPDRFLPSMRLPKGEYKIGTSWADIDELSGH